MHSYCIPTVPEAWNSLSTLGPVLVSFHITGIWHALVDTYSSLVQTRAGSRLLCAGGGHNQARGQGGRLGPLWVQGKALVGGSGALPDGKRFSIL